MNIITRLMFAVNFQYKPVNAGAKFSESCFFNVFVRTDTVHYAWLDMKCVTFKPPNVIFIQFIDQNGKVYCCLLVDYSEISDSVK